MTVLTKITDEDKKYDNLVYSGELGKFSTARVDEENYLILHPYQAKLLQDLGAELEFYQSTKAIIPGFPPSEGTKAEKTSLNPELRDSETEKYDAMLEELRKKLN